MSVLYILFIDSHRRKKMMTSQKSSMGYFSKRLIVRVFVFFEPLFIVKNQEFFV